MITNFFRRSLAKLRELRVGTSAENHHSEHKTSNRRTADLMQSVPESLSDSYKRPLDQPELDGIFLRMRRNIYKSLDDVEELKGENQALRESGTLMTGKPYFYIKPFNESGWLFERTDTGWIISKAEKIYGQDSFIRSDHAWDIASVLSNASGKATPRVNSSRFELELVSLSLYEDQVKSRIFGDMLR